jgi:hypothetical protein
MSTAGDRFQPVLAPRTFGSSLLVACLIVGFLGSWASVAAGQERSPSQLGTSPLGIRQQRVERMVEELEQKFKTVKLAIQQKEPERAERLQQALNKAKELLLEKRMADVTRLLDESQFDLAGDGQQALLADLRELVGVLLNAANGRDKATEKMDLLSQWKKEIQKLTLVQREEKADGERLAKQPQSAAPSLSKWAELRRKQQAIADEARDLAAKMQHSGASAWPSGQARPGQANVSGAQQAMQRATAKLDSQDAGGAGAQQEQALGELDAANSEIDAALDELRDQAETQALAGLENLFRDLLLAQQKLTAETAAMQQKRLAAEGQLARADRNAVRVIGDEERRTQAVATAEGMKDVGLAGKAQLAADILADVSGELAATVGGLRDQLITVGNLLADELRTDADIAAKQAKIEATLQTLIDAVKKMQAEKSKAAADAQAEGGNQAAASGSSNKQSQQAAQGGKKGGGSKGIDTDATARSDTALPHSPWSQLRDKDRDPVFSAIKEKFPARYQQLIEQYYRSFSDESRE